MSVETDDYYSVEDAILGAMVDGFGVVPLLDGNGFKAEHADGRSLILVKLESEAARFGDIGSYVWMEW